MACYTFELSDAGGDGWSDNSISFTNAFANVFYTFSMGNGSTQTYSTCYACTDPDACNFDGNPSILTNNSYCIYTEDDCDTCSDEYDGTGYVVNNDIDGDGVCDSDEIPGCLDELACNYEPLATNYGYCDFSCYGCLDALAVITTLMKIPLRTTHYVFILWKIVILGENDGTGIVLNNDADGMEFVTLRMDVLTIQKMILMETVYVQTMKFLMSRFYGM